MQDVHRVVLDGGWDKKCQESLQEVSSRQLFSLMKSLTAPCPLYSMLSNKPVPCSVYTMCIELERNQVMCNTVQQSQ